MEMVMRRIGKMFPVLAAVTAALTLTVAGCANGGGGPAEAQVQGVEKPNLTVAVVPAVDSAGFFIALHDGLFKAQGLNVHFEPAISSVPPMISAASNAIIPGNEKREWAP